MARDLFDPRLMTELANFTPSTCTIQQNLGTENDHGEIVDDWQDVAGHVDLPCTHAPSGSPGNEYKRRQGDYVIADHTTLISGAYPLIKETMRVVVAGGRAGTYEILLVHVDSHSTMTRLESRRTE